MTRRGLNDEPRTKCTEFFAKHDEYMDLPEIEIEENATDP
jgi:hypothetical protein